MDQPKGYGCPHAPLPDPLAATVLPGKEMALAAGEAIQAVGEALARLGSSARAWELADYIRLRLGIPMRAGEVAIIRSRLSTQGAAAPLAESDDPPGATVPV